MNEVFEYKIAKKFASRKFIIAFLLIVLSSVAAAFKIMDGDNLMWVYTIVGTGYGFFNYMSEKISNAPSVPK